MREKEARKQAADESKSMPGHTYCVWQVRPERFGFVVYNAQSPGPLKGHQVAAYKAGKLVSPEILQDWEDTAKNWEDV